LWKEPFEALWNPVFSPAGDKLLVRGVKDGVYSRRVVALKELL
jgi:hypothetical protein